MNQKTQIQNENIASLPDIVHGILLYAMRVGKTRIAIKKLALENCNSILWVTPSPKLRDKDIPDEFVKWGEEDLLKRTKIVTYAGLKKVVGHFDKIVLDELQDLTPANSINLLNGKITYNSIMGLTGELPKHKEKLDIYSRLNLSVIKEISLDEAIELGLVEDYKVHVIYTQLSEEKDIEVKSANFTFKTSEKDNYKYLNNKIERPEIINGIQYDLKNQRVFINKREYKLKQYVPKFECDKSYLILHQGQSQGYIAFKNEEIFGSFVNSQGKYLIKGNDLTPLPNKFDIIRRMKSIYNLNSKLTVAKQLIQNLKGRTISFAGSIEHARSISDYNYHSKTDKTYLNKFINKEIDLLSCVNTGSVGDTYTNVNNIVIVQTNSNKKGSISQKIGRGLLLDGSGVTNIYMLVAKDTVDERWLFEVLKDIDVKRVSYYNNINELNENI